jgi:putative molybdopterin biosynthesis protein
MVKPGDDARRARQGAMPDYLTTKELAELLRIKERKVYELVSDNLIPVSRVTGKLLFPRDIIEAWLSPAHRVRHRSGSPQEP